MQAKTIAFQTTASKIGLKINTEKTKVMRIITCRTKPIRLGDNEIEDVTSFTNLGSIVDTSGGTDQDIKIRIGKARTAYILLRKIWNSRELSRPTKFRIFKSNVKAVLFLWCKSSPRFWCRDIAHKCLITQASTVLHHQMPTQNS